MKWCDSNAISDIAVSTLGDQKLCDIPMAKLSSHIKGGNPVLALAVNVSAIGERTRNCHHVPCVCCYPKFSVLVG